MGTILNSKTTNDGKIIFEVLVDYEEALQLRGHINNIYMFSEEVIDVTSHIALRGKNDATKYLLIPRELRKELKFNSAVKCQKIETPTNTIFVYMLNKISI